MVAEPTQCAWRWATILMNTDASVAPPRITILVVDDDEAVRNSIKFVLEIEGFVVHAFASGPELLEQPDFSSSGCLVVDQHMPNMNGIDLISELRRQGISIPAVLVTGNPNNMLRERAAGAGIPVVEKPLLGSALVDMIRRALGRPSG